jgi:hypothetical protein
VFVAEFSFFVPHFLFQFLFFRKRGDATLMRFLRILLRVFLKKIFVFLRAEKAEVVLLDGSATKV